MIVDRISDLHGHYPQLEGGDLLIVAGDLTARANKIEGYASPNHSPTLLMAITGDSKPLGGKLNPTWVEWLMGYPKEYTVLKDWAMQWFRLNVKKHSKSLRALRNKPPNKK